MVGLSGRRTFECFYARPRLLSGAASLALLLMPSQAPAQPGSIYGDAGGRYFEYKCAPGQILVGLSGSAGILIDNIQAICGRVTGQGDFVDAAAQGPKFGNNRPEDKRVQCPQGYGIANVTIALNDDHPQVGGIRLFCQELGNRVDGGITMLELRGSGHLENYESPMMWDPSIEIFAGGWSDCPGQYAVGIRGRAEQYLSAFGLMCGSAAAAVDANAGHTLGKRKKRPPSAIGERTSGGSTMTSIPGLRDQPRTLGKRKRPMPTGGAGSESNPMAGQPAQSDQPVGVSLNSDGGVPLPEPAVPAEPPSPLINGSYATTVTVTDSRCFTQDLRGTWRGMAELQPQPGIMIPLQTFTPLFAAPVTVQVAGLVISQSTQIQLRAGSIGGAVPATFNGAFSNDGSQFNVRFTAGTPICRIGGTISGMRN